MEISFTTPQGFIGIIEEVPLFHGDHPAIDRLTMMTFEPWIIIRPNLKVPIDWTKPGSIMLALGLAEPGFRVNGRWHHYLPDRYKNAEIPELDFDSKPGRIY